MTAYITVVYSVADENAFRDELNRVMELFAGLGQQPWAITAVSMDDEIKRTELIQEAVHQEDYEIIPAVLAHPDIGNVSSIDEL